MYVAADVFGLIPAGWPCTRAGQWSSVFTVQLVDVATAAPGMATIDVAPSAKPTALAAAIRLALVILMFPPEIGTISQIVRVVATGPSLLPFPKGANRKRRKHAFIGVDGTPRKQGLSPHAGG
jgi:hypothetical protein